MGFLERTRSFCNGHKLVRRLGNLMTVRFWIAIGLSAGLRTLFLATVDIRRMLDSLAGASYGYLAPGIALYFVGVWIRTLRWQALLRHLKSAPVARLFPVVVVGYMANHLLPMRIGELVRSYHVSEREGVSKASAFATIMIERVMDAVTLLALVAVAAGFLPVVGLARALGDRSGVPWPLLAAGACLPFFAMFGALLLLALYPSRTSTLIGMALRPLPEGAGRPLTELAHLFLDGLTALRSPTRIAGLFLLSAPIWLLEAALFYLAGLSFGLQDAFGSRLEMALTMVVVTAIAKIGSSVPGAPGGLGLFELIVRETLVLLPLASIDRSVAAGYSAVVHAALLLPMILLGQAFLWSEHLSLRRLWRGGGARDPAPADGPRRAGLRGECE